MFRSLFRGPRTVRVPIDKSNVEIQQVRVTKQSRPVVGRFILTFIVTTAVIQGIKRWDPLGTYAQRDVLQEEMEKVKKGTAQIDAGKGKDQFDTDHAMFTKSRPIGFPSGAIPSEAIRLTVPIWLRQGYRRFYKETDPEWKEFVKLQGDAKRIEQIKRQIGESVMHQVRDLGQHEFELRVIKFTGRVGVNLELAPQIFTPPVYEVPCIWLSSQSCHIGWRPLPHQTGAKMERVFRPVVLLEASTAAVQTFFYMTYAMTKAKAMEALGWKRPDGKKSVIVLPRLPSQSSDASEAQAIPEDSSKSTKPIFPFFPDLDKNGAMKKIHADVVSSMPYSSVIQHAASAFDYIKGARQKMAVARNLRGICQVRGFITFIGERGKFRLEIVAYYLPVDNVFVGAVSVKSGYIVQNYQAWDKEMMQGVKQKAQKILKGPVVDSDVPKPSTEAPSAPTPASNEDEEKNK